MRKKSIQLQTAQMWYSTAVEQLDSVTTQIGSSTAKQHSCQETLGRGPFQGTRLCSALLCSAPLCSCAGLLCCAPISLVSHFQCFSSSWGNIVFSLWWKGKWSCSDWLVNIAVQLQMDGEILQSYRLKYDPRNSCIKPGSDGRNIVQEGSSVQEAGSLVQNSPWNAVCVGGPYVEIAARLCIFKFEISKAMRSPSWSSEIGSTPERQKKSSIYSVKYYACP